MDAGQAVTGVSAAHDDPVTVVVAGGVVGGGALGGGALGGGALASGTK